MKTLLVHCALSLCTAVGCVTVDKSKSDGMVSIPAGDFFMGTDSSEIHGLMQRYGISWAGLFLPETPAHRVRINAFYMDAHEVTNADFKRFVDANPEWSKQRIAADLHNGDYLKHWNGDSFPEGQADYPVIYVTWHAALAYAVWCDKRLPTESEWEWAARGGLTDQEFPWGDQIPDSTRANFAGANLAGATAVGNYSANGYGLYDMAGNVWEFCYDAWRDDAYQKATLDNPVTGGWIVTDSINTVSGRRVIRGGSWGGHAVNLRVRYRDSHPVTGAGNHVGFRCVRPVDPQEFK